MKQYCSVLILQIKKTKNFGAMNCAAKHNHDIVEFCKTMVLKNFSDTMLTTAAKWKVSIVKLCRKKTSTILINLCAKQASMNHENTVKCL